MTYGKKGYYFISGMQVNHECITRKCQYGMDDGVGSRRHGKLLRKEMTELNKIKVFMCHS